MIGYGLETKAVSECKPDPEKMLERTRANKEIINKKLDDMKRINNWGYTPGTDQTFMAITALIGNLMCQLWDAEKEIEYWLDEINK